MTVQANGFQRTGIPVPGGVVWIDLRRGRSAIVHGALVALQVPFRGSSWLPLRPRDIVISDDESDRELYREGPFDSFSVNRPLKELLEVINSRGLESFLKSQHLASKEIGPLQIASGQSTVNGAASYMFTRLKRAIRRNSN